MVRGNGSARAEMGVKATARPNTIRITMRRGPLPDSLDDNLSTISRPPFVTSVALAQERSFRLARDAQRNGPVLLMASLYGKATNVDFDPTAGRSLSPRGVIQTGMRILHQCRDQKKGQASGRDPLARPP